MKEELLNIIYIEQVIDQVMTVLGLTHEFLTQNEKLNEIKDKDIDVHTKLIALIDKGALDEDFHSNREKLLKSLEKR